MGLPLTIIAILLLYIFSPVCILFAIVSGYALSSKNKYFKRIAKSLDQLGNVIGGPLLNTTLIKQCSKDRFGSEDETISSVLGKNKLSGCLTNAGMALSNILDRLDKNHVEKSIE